MGVLYIHSKSGCGACVEARDYLLKLDVPFEEFNVEVDQVARDRLIRDQHKFVPQFYIDDHRYIAGGLRTLRTMRREEILSILT